MYYIPMLDSILKRSMQEKPIYTYSSKEFLDLYKNMLLLSMRLISVREFKNNLDFLPKEDLRTLCTRVREDATILLSLRGFIYYLFQNKGLDTKEVMQAFKLFEIGRGTPYSMAIQNLEIITFLRETGILEEYYESLKDIPPALTPKEVRKLCVESIRKLKPFFNLYIYKKLRFLVIANETSAEDLMATLISMACINCYDLQSLYRDKKLFNTIKKATSRFGSNIISYYTTKSRRRLVESGDAYANKVISTNIDDSNGEEILNYIPSENNSYHSSEITLSLRILNTIIENKYGKGSVISRLAKILGNNNTEFVKWYNQKKHTRYRDALEIQKKEKARFLFSIQQYLGVSMDKLTKVLTIVKPRLQEYL